MVKQTCRICRLEGSESNPLYYPCKCRGSIKYVHQDCLQAWMKHSNRAKSCDICDTEYKFTVVYKNGTPDKIPLIVLVKSTYKLVLTSIKSLVPNVLRLSVVAILLLLFPVYFFVVNSSLQLIINSILFSCVHNSLENSETSSRFYISVPQNQTIGSFLFENDSFEKPHNTTGGEFFFKAVIREHYIEYLSRLAIPIAIFVIGFCIRQFILDDHGYPKMISKFFGNSSNKRITLFRLRVEYQEIIRQSDKILKNLEQRNFKKNNHTCYEKDKSLNDFENEYCIKYGDLVSFKYDPSVDASESEQKLFYELSLKFLYQRRFGKSGELEEIREILLSEYQKRLEHYEKTLRSRYIKILNAIDELITAIDDSADKERLKYLYDRVCIVQLGSLRDYDELNKVAQDAGFGGLIDELKLNTVLALFEPGSITHNITFFGKGYSIQNIDPAGDPEAEQLIDEVLEKYFLHNHDLNSHSHFLNFSRLQGFSLNLPNSQSHAIESETNQPVDVTPIARNKLKEELKRERRVNPFSINGDGNNALFNEQMINRIAEMNNLNMPDEDNEEIAPQQVENNNIVINLMDSLPSFLMIMQYAGIIYGLGFVFALIFYAFPMFLGIGISGLTFVFLSVFVRLLLKVIPGLDTWQYLYSHNLLLKCSLYVLNLLFQLIIGPILTSILSVISNGYISNTTAKWLILISYSSLIYVANSYLNRIRYRIVVKHEAPSSKSPYAILIFQILLIFKALIIFGLELLVFPLYCGFLMDMSLSSLFLDDLRLQVPNPFDKSNDTSETILNIFANTAFIEASKGLMNANFFSMWVPLEILKLLPINLSYIYYWGLGTLYMYSISLFVGMVRDRITRPGVLYFLRSPDDQNGKFFHDALVKPFALQIHRIFLSGIIYSIFIVIGIGMVTLFLRIGVPYALVSDKYPDGINFFPIYLNFWILSLSLLLFITIYYTADTHTLQYYIRKYWIKSFAMAARLFRFSSFILDNDISKERGTLVYRTTLHRLLKLFVMDIIGINSLTKKFGLKPEYAKPCSKSNVNKFFRENLNLNVVFVPDGNYYRVPENVSDNRSYLRTLFVPVTKDDTKLPYNHKIADDYHERAKKTHQYYYSDSEDELAAEPTYSVVYIPPNFQLRVFGFLFTLWLCSIFIFAAVGFTSFAIGQFILLFFVQPTATVYQMNSLSIMLGLFIICVIVLPVIHSNDIVNSMLRVKNLMVIMFRDVVGDLALFLMPYLLFSLGSISLYLVSLYHKLVLFYFVQIPYDIITTKEVKEQYKFENRAIQVFTIFGDSFISIPSLFNFMNLLIFFLPFAYNLLVCCEKFLVSRESSKSIIIFHLKSLLPDALIFISLAVIFCFVVTFFGNSGILSSGSELFKAVPDREAVLMVDENRKLFFKHLDLDSSNKKRSVILEIMDDGSTITANFSKVLDKINLSFKWRNTLEFNITYLLAVMLLSFTGLFFFFSASWKLYKAYIWINGFVKKNFYASDIKLENAEQADDDDSDNDSDDESENEDKDDNDSVVDYNGDNHPYGDDRRQDDYIDHFFDRRNLDTRSYEFGDNESQDEQYDYGSDEDYYAQRGDDENFDNYDQSHDSYDYDDDDCDDEDDSDYDSDYDVNNFNGNQATFSSLDQADKRQVSINDLTRSQSNLTDKAFKERFSSCTSKTTSIKYENCLLDDDHDSSYYKVNLEKNDDENHSFHKASDRLLAYSNKSTVKGNVSADLDEKLDSKSVFSSMKELEILQSSINNIINEQSELAV